MITVNSTSAFDSLINKKPVFVLGRTFYSNSNSVTTIKDIRNLTEEIDSFIKKGFELEHTVEGVLFENVVLDGKKVEAKKVRMNEFVKAVKFK